MKAEVALTGGCGGHYGEDDRCYCDSADVHIEFSCPNAVDGSYQKVGPKNRLTFVKNKNRCKQNTLKVGELSDQYSMARWFTEHYVPTDKVGIF